MPDNNQNPLEGGYDNDKAFEGIDNIIQYSDEYDRALSEYESDLSGRSGALDTAAAYASQFIGGVARPFAGPLRRFNEAVGIAEPGDATRAAARYDAGNEAMNRAGYYPEKEEGFFNNLDYYLAHGAMGAAQNAPTSLIGGGIGAGVAKGALGAGRMAMGTRAAAGTANALRAAAVSAKAGQAGALGGQVAVFSASAADMAYEQAKSQGMTDAEAREYALKQGANEGIVTTAFNLVGAGGIERMVAKGVSRDVAQEVTEQVSKSLIQTTRDAAKNYGINLTQELAEELTIETFANVIESNTLDPTATDFESMVDTWAMTAAQTILMTGGMQAGGAALRGAGNQITERVPALKARRDQREAEYEQGRQEILDQQQALADMQQVAEIVESRRPELQDRLAEEQRRSAENDNPTPGFDAQDYPVFYSEGVDKEAEILRTTGEFTEENYDATYGDQAYAEWQQRRAAEEQAVADQAQAVADAQAEAAGEQAEEEVSDETERDVDDAEVAGWNEDGQELRSFTDGTMAVQEDDGWRIQTDETSDDPAFDIDRDVEDGPPVVEPEAETSDTETQETPAPEVPAPETPTPETSPETPADPPVAADVDDVVDDEVDEESDEAERTVEVIAEDILPDESRIKDPGFMGQLLDDANESGLFYEMRDYIQEKLEGDEESLALLDEVLEEYELEDEVDEETEDEVDEETVSDDDVDWDSEEYFQDEESDDDVEEESDAESEGESEAASDAEDATDDSQEQETAPLRSWSDGKEPLLEISLSETDDGKFVVNESRSYAGKRAREFDSREEADRFYSKQRSIAVASNTRRALKEDDGELQIDRSSDGVATESSLKDAVERHFEGKNPWQKGEPLKRTERNSLIGLETEPLAYHAQTKLAQLYQEQEGLSEEDAMSKARGVIAPWAKLYREQRQRKERYQQRYLTEYEVPRGLVREPLSQNFSRLESDIRVPMIDFIDGIENRKKKGKQGANAKSRVKDGLSLLEEGPDSSVIEDAKYKIPEREMGIETDPGSEKGKWESTRGTKTESISVADGSVDVTSKLKMFGTAPTAWEASATAPDGREVVTFGNSRSEAVEAAVSQVVTQRQLDEDRKSKVYTKQELDELANLPSKNLRKRELRFIAAAREIVGAQTARYKTLVKKILEQQGEAPAEASSPSGPVQFDKQESDVLRTVLESKAGRNQLSGPLRELIQDNLNLQQGFDSPEAAIEQAISDAVAALDGPVDVQGLGELSREALLRALDQDMAVIAAPSTSEDQDVLDMPTGGDISKLQRALNSAKLRVQEAMGTLPEGAFIDENGDLLVPLTVTASQFNDELDWWKNTIQPDSDQNVNLDARAEKQGMMKQKDADKKKAEWQAEIDRQSNLASNKNRREGADENYNKVIISLFDRTGEWARPWAEAGYTVYRYDVQEDGAVNEEGEPVWMGEFFEGSVEDVNWMEVRDNIHAAGMEVYGILAGVPCTHFSRAGNKFWKEKDADGRTAGTNTEGPREGLNLLNVTMGLIEEFKPAVWAVENPMGRIQKLGNLPDPALRFQPANFGDPYDKETYLWGLMNTNLPLAPVVPVDGSKMHSDYGGKSLATKNARAETPKGFAKAFFLANNYLDAPAHMRAHYDAPMFAPQITEAVDAGLAYEEALEVALDYDPHTHAPEEVADALNEAIAQKNQLAKLTKPENIASLPPFSVYQMAKTGFLVRLDNNVERGAGDPLFETREEAQAEADRLKEIAESQPASTVDVNANFVDARNEKQSKRGKWEKELRRSLFGKAELSPLREGALRDKHVKGMNRDELATEYEQVFGKKPAITLTKDGIVTALQGVRDEFDEAMRWLSNGRRVTAREAAENFPSAFNMLVSRGYVGAWYAADTGKTYGLPHAMLEQTLATAFPDISRNSLDKAHEYMDNSVVSIFPVAQHAEKRMEYIDLNRWSWNEKRKQIMLERSSDKSPYEIQKEQYELDQQSGARANESVKQATKAAADSKKDDQQVSDDEQDALREAMRKQREELRGKKESKKKKKKLGKVTDKRGQMHFFEETVGDANAAYDLNDFLNKYVVGEFSLVQYLTDMEFTGDRKRSLKWQDESDPITFAYDIGRMVWNEARLSDRASVEDLMDGWIADEQKFDADDYFNELRQHAINRIASLHYNGQPDPNSGMAWPDRMIKQLEEAGEESPRQMEDWAGLVAVAIKEIAEDRFAIYEQQQAKKKLGKKKKASAKLGDKAKKAGSKRADKAAKLKRLADGMTGANPVLSEVTLAAVEYMVAVVEEKAYTYAAFIAEAAEELGPEYMEKVGRFLDAAWKISHDDKEEMAGGVLFDEPVGTWRDHVPTDPNGIVHDDKSEQEPVTDKDSKPLKWLKKRDRELKSLFRETWEGRDDLRRILKNLVGEEKLPAKNSSKKDYTRKIRGIQETYESVLQEAEDGQFIPHRRKDLEPEQDGMSRMDAIAFLKEQGALLDASKMADGDEVMWVSPESLLQKRLTEQFPAISRANLDEIISQVQSYVAGEIVSDKASPSILRAVVWEDVFTDFPFAKTGRKVEFTKEDASVAVENPAADNAAMIVNSQGGISPNAFYISGMTRAPKDIAEAVANNRPIGVAYESYKDGKFLKLSDGIVSAMVDHVVDYQLPLFIDSGMFSWVINGPEGQTPDWTDVMNFYDSFLDQVQERAELLDKPPNFQLISMVMPDKLVRQSEATDPNDFIVGLGMETELLQRRYANSINDLGKRGVKLIMPVQRPALMTASGTYSAIAANELIAGLDEGNNFLFDRAMTFLDPALSYEMPELNEDGEPTGGYVEIDEAEFSDRLMEGVTWDVRQGFTIGKNAIVGIPYGKSPWPDDNIMDLVQRYRDLRRDNGSLPELELHLLGGGASKVIKLFNKLREIDPTVVVKGDAATENVNRGEYDGKTGLRKQPYDLPRGNDIVAVMGQFWKEGNEAPDLKKLRQTIYANPDFAFTGDDRKQVDAILAGTVIDQFERIVGEHQDNPNPQVMQDALVEFFFKQPFRKLESNGNPSIFKDARDNDRGGLGGAADGPLADLRIYLEDSDGRSDSRRNSGDQEGGGRAGSDSDATDTQDGGELEGDSAGNVSSAEGGGGTGRGSGDTGDGIPETGGQTGSGGDGSTGRSSDVPPTTGDGGLGAPVSEPEPAASVRAGYHLTPDKYNSIVGGGKVTKFDRNIAAIQVLQEVQRSNVPPTQEQLDTLAGYTGWGQFGEELFKGTYEESREVPEGWEQRDEWLKSHLGKEAWETLKMSIVNAHYTAPQVVDAMWGMMRKLGFNGGSVLEPAIGSGNFFSVMPRDLYENSQLTGIDTEKIAAGISQTLHPAATVLDHSYALDNAPNNHYDLVISNVPFGKYPMSDRATKNQRIHNFFFEKALRQVKEGGLVAMITSKGSLDAADAKGLRSGWHRQADIVGVVRLPGDAFAQNAGTRVVTDIIIMRKRREGEPEAENQPIIREVGELEVDNLLPAKDDPRERSNVKINQHFIDNPQDVLGTTVFDHSLYGPDMRVNSLPNSDLAEQLAEWTKTLPENIFNADDTSHVMRKRIEKGDNTLQNSVKFDPDIEYVTSYYNKKKGATTTNTLQGAFVARRGNEWIPIWDDKNKKGHRWHRANVTKFDTLEQRKEAMRSLVDVADKLQILLDAQTKGEAEEERQALNDAYDSHKARHGNINLGKKNNPLVTYLRNVGDPRANTLLSLDAGGEKAPIFTQNTVRAKKSLVEGEASVEDAFIYVRNQNPRSIDIKEMMRLTGLPKAEIEQKLIEGELAYRTAGNRIEAADIFLSGNVREKLLSLEQARDKEGKRGLDKSIDILKSSIPKTIGYEKIKVNMGAMWIPAEYYATFLSEISGIPPQHIRVQRIGNNWRAEVTPRGLQLAGEEMGDWTAPGKPFHTVANAAMGKQKLKVYVNDPNGNSVFSQTETDSLNGRIDMMRDQFRYWVWGELDRKDVLEKAYNERYNSTIPLQPKNIPLTMEGLSLFKGDVDFDYRDHQKAAIYKGLVYGKGLFAHEVGTGKTLTMAGLALEAKRLGLASKPLLFGHNANYAEVAAAVQEAYPAAKILVVNSLNPQTAAQEINSIGTGDWDLVIMPESQMKNIKFQPDTIRGIMQELLDNLETAARAAQDDEDGQSIEFDLDVVVEDKDAINALNLKPTAKKLVKERWKIISQIDEAIAESSVSSDQLFENWGTDMMLIDEVHKYKKLPIASKMNVKGMEKSSSKQASQLYLATQYIQNMNNGRNVFTFTGTPITNTVSELFNQMRYIMTQEMKDADIDQWDGWFGTFAEATTEMEVSPGGQLQDVERIRNFVNIPELRQFMSTYLDTVFADEMIEYTPRKSREGRTTDPKENSSVPYMQVENVVSDMTEAQVTIQAELARRNQRWLDANGEARREMMQEPGRPDTPGTLNMLTNPLALDPRLAGGDVDPKDPRLKVNQMVAKVKEIYERDSDSTQMIFVDAGWGKTGERTIGKDPTNDEPIKEEVRIFESEHTDSETYVEEVIKRLMEETGVSRDEIVIYDGDAEKKAKLSKKMNSGEVKFAIGSTEKMGTGVNAQQKLRAIHHLDAPWTPAEFEQRNGRIRRQGNEWNTVLQYRYMTKSRAEARRWQFLLAKLNFINAFMRNKGVEREMEVQDDDSGMGLLEAFDSALGDPRVTQKTKLKSKLDRLKQQNSLFDLMQVRQRQNMEELQRSLPFQTRKYNAEKELYASHNAERNKPARVKTLAGKWIEQNSMQVGSVPVTYQGLGWSDQQDEPTQSIVGNQAINEFVFDEYERISENLSPNQSEVIGQYRGNYVVIHRGTHYQADLYLATKDTLDANPQMWKQLYAPTKISEGDPSEKVAVLRSGGAHNGRKLFVQQVSKTMGTIKSGLPRFKEELVEMERKLSKFDPDAPVPRFPDKYKIDEMSRLMEMIDHELSINAYGSPFFLQTALPLSQPFFYEGKEYAVAGWRGRDMVLADTGERTEEQVVTDVSPAGGLERNEVIPAKYVYTAFPAKDVTDFEGTPLVPELQDDYQGENVDDDSAYDKVDKAMGAGVAILVNVPQDVRDENPTVGQFKLPSPVLLGETVGPVNAGDEQVDLKFGDQTVTIPARLFNMASRATDSQIAEASPTLQRKWYDLVEGRAVMSANQAAKEFRSLGRQEDAPVKQAAYLNEILGGLLDVYGFGESGSPFSERDIDSREELIEEYSQRLTALLDSGSGGSGPVRMGFNRMSPGNTRRPYPVNNAPVSGNQQTDRPVDSEFSTEVGEPRRGFLARSRRRANRSAREIGERLSRLFNVPMRYQFTDHDMRQEQTTHGYYSGLAVSSGQDVTSPGAPRSTSAGVARTRSTEVQNLALQVHELAHGLDDIYGVSELFGEWENIGDRQIQNFIETALRTVISEAGDMPRLLNESRRSGSEFAENIQRMIAHLSTDEMIRRRSGNPLRSMTDNDGNEVGELNERSYLREAMKDFFTLYFMPENDFANELRDEYDGYRGVENWFNDNVMNSSAWRQSDMRRGVEEIQRRDLGELIQLNHALKEMDYDQNRYSDTRTVVETGDGRHRVQRIHDMRRPHEGFAEFARAYMTQDSSTWDDIPGFRTVLSFFEGRTDFEEMMTRLTQARAIIGEFRHRSELDRINSMVLDAGNTKNKAGLLGRIADSVAGDVAFQERVQRGRQLLENLYRRIKDRARPLKLNADAIRRRDREATAANRRRLEREAAAQGLDPSQIPAGVEATQDTFEDNATAYELFDAYSNTAPSFVDEALSEGVFLPDRIVQGNSAVNRMLGAPRFYEALGQLEDEQDRNRADLYMVIRHQQMMNERGGLPSDYRWPINNAEGRRWMDNLTPEQENRYDAVFRAANNMLNELRIMEYKMGLIGWNDVERMFAAYTLERDDEGKMVRDAAFDLPLADAYIPMMRVQLDTDNVRPIKGQRVLNTAELNRRSKVGSDREVLSPIAASIAKAFNSYNAVNRHMQMTELIRSNQAAGLMGRDVVEVDPADKLNSVTIDEVMNSLVKEGLLTKGEAKAINIADRLFRQVNNDLEVHGNVNLTDQDLDDIAAIAEMTGHQIADITDFDIARGVERGLADRQGIVSEDVQEIIDMLDGIPSRFGLLHWNTEDVDAILRKNANVFVLRTPVRRGDTDIYGKPLRLGEMRVRLFEISKDLQKGIDVVHPMMENSIIRASRQANDYYKSGAIGFNPQFGLKQYTMDTMAATYNSTELNAVERFPLVIVAKSIWDTFRTLARTGQDYWFDSDSNSFENELDKVWRLFSGGMNPDMSMAMGQDKSAFINQAIRKKGFQTKRERVVNVLKPIQTNNSLNPLKWTAGPVAKVVREVVTSADAGPRKQEALAYLRNRGITLNSDGQFVDAQGNRTFPSQKVLVGAIRAGNDLTYNYKRIGYTMQVVETIRPFTQAMLEGIDKAMRVLIEDFAAPFTQRGVNTPEARGRMRRAKSNLAYFIGINLSVQLVRAMLEGDDDDEDVEKYDWAQLAGFTIDFDGDGVTDLQTPGLRENSIRQHAGELAVEAAKAMLGTDESLSESEARLINKASGRFTRMMDSLAHQSIDLTLEDMTSPTRMAQWAAQSGWPSIVMGALTNHNSFRDQPIENPWDVLNNELKSERYNRSTTRLFTKPLVKDFVGDILNTSPAMLDYETNMLSGGAIQRSAQYTGMLAEGYSGYGEFTGVPYIPGAKAYMPARRQMQSSKDLYKHKSLLEDQKKLAERDGTGWTKEHEGFLARINTYEGLHTFLLKAGKDAEGEDARIIDNMAIGLARAGLMRKPISTGTDPLAMNLPKSEWPKVLTTPQGEQVQSFYDKAVAVVANQYRNLDPPERDPNKPLLSKYADGRTKLETVLDDRQKAIDARAFFEYYLYETDSSGKRKPKQVTPPVIAAGIKKERN